jgi:hypothetical protein
MQNLCEIVNISKNILIEKWNVTLLFKNYVEKVYVKKL